MSGIVWRTVSCPNAKSEMGESQKEGDERLGRVEAKDDEVMKTKGTINVWFDDGRQYGFIHETKAGVVLKHFLHESNIITGTPRTGAEVLFRSVVTRKGYLAVQVEVLGGVE